MIHKVFELEDTLVREVMVPRPDMFCLDVRTPAGINSSASCASSSTRGCRCTRRTSTRSSASSTRRICCPYVRGLPRDFDLPRPPPPALLRAGVQARRRAPPRVPGEEAPPGDRGRRVRRHGGSGVARGSPRGAGGRDPRRVRRGGAPHPARGRATTFRVSGKLLHRRAQHGRRARRSRRRLRHRRRLGARPLRPRAAQGRERRRVGNVTVSVEKVERTRVVEVLVSVRPAPSSRERPA